MKALSLIQPWASLIALDAKRIETRSWATRYTGPLAIHASATMPLRLGERLVLGEWEVERDRAGLLLRGPISWPYRLPQSAVVAVVDLAYVRSTDSPECQPGSTELPLGDYSPGRYAWYLTSVSPIKQPIAAKGARGLWNWSPPDWLAERLRYPKVLETASASADDSHAAALDGAQ